ncbi:MAG TPA: TldD/PmbA family protein [Gemmatimonadaceae bacterium]|nr:TldD/PmbA family protein [Gemmatimonadaceae bacterium]
MSFPKRLLGDAAHGVLAAPNAVLTREEAQALIERTVRFSKADAIRVNVQSTRESNVRFAANQMSTAGLSNTTTIRVQSGFGKRKASVVTNSRTDEGLKRAVEQSEALAKLAPEDPEYLGELGAQQFVAIPAWFDSTAALSAEDRAKAAMTALGPARAAKDLTVAGFLVTTARATAIGNNAGLFAYHRGTDVNYTLTSRTNDGTGSGWAGAATNDWSKLDFDAVARRSIEKARASRNPVALEPGRYTVVLEPDATSDLIPLMSNALQARAAEEGRSAFSKGQGATRVGEKIVDERVTLSSNPSDALILSTPFDNDGMPLGGQTWIERGVLKQLAYSRFWASKQGKSPTGGAGSLRLDGGTETLDQVIAGTQRGVLVTHCWYIRPVDQRTLVFTGLTRDGTFLIENGKIARPIKNFRFNESPLFMLNNLDAIGRPVRTASGDAMPPIRVRDFNFASLSDAV